MAEEVEVIETEEVPLDKTPTIQEYKAGKAAEAKAAAEAIEKDPEEQKVNGETKEKDIPKVKGGFQKRIDRLIKQVASTEEERDRLKAELAKGGKKTEEVSTKVDEGEPQREKFDTDAEYMKAMIKYGVAETLREQAEAKARADAEKHHKEVISTYNQRVVEAKSRLDDWDEVMNQELELPKAVGMAILRMPNGPDVAYQIGKNPELAEELMQMDEEEARGKAWELSRELGGSKKAEAESEEEEAEPEPEKKKEKEKPEPIKPVGASGKGISTIPLDKVTDMKLYRKLRESGRVR